jgi:hypothetical protein
MKQKNKMIGAMVDHLLIQMVFDVDACGDCVAYSPHLNGDAFIKDFPQKTESPAVVLHHSAGLVRYSK